MHLKNLRVLVLAVLLLGSTPSFGAAAAADDGNTLTVQALPRPSASVALGASRVPMLTVRLTASCTRDVSVASIAFRHKGLGNPRDIERIYAQKSGMRLTRSVPLTDKQGIGRLQFRGFAVKACATEAIDILADFSPSASAAGEHQLVIESDGDVVTDPPVRVLINPAGIAVTVPVGQPAGLVSSELLPLPQALTYGSARTAARLRIRGDARNDLHLTSITFTNDGTALNDDVQNLFLETSGHTRLSATVPSLDGDSVRLVVDPPLLIRRNEVRLLQVRADIRASRRKTVILTVEEPSDIVTGPAAR